jgi:hypothetical protein
MARTPPPGPKDISQAYQDLFYPVEEPDCIKCHDTGLLSDTKPRHFCDCPKGLLQHDMMLDGAFDGL